jgi:hypothetical protein
VNQNQAHCCSSSSLHGVTFSLPVTLPTVSVGEDGMRSGGGHNRNNFALQMGLLDTLLRTEWDDRKDAGLFRYDVAACPSLMVPGAYGFIAQLNEGRASKKRPTEFRVDQVSLTPVCASLSDTVSASVCSCHCTSSNMPWPKHPLALPHLRIAGGLHLQVAQAFDGAKFNFTKALQKEVLVQFEPVLEKQPAYEAKVQLLFLQCDDCGWWDVSEEGCQKRDTEHIPCPVTSGVPLHPDQCSNC